MISHDGFDEIDFFLPIPTFNELIVPYELAVERAVHQIEWRAEI